ncbi:MAG: polysaccharide deacetylase family protein [Bacteriovoracaceae bacterium]|nr:polysaccharide deacetylase family protein [Bacteriovoracaceae bacterium]
MKKKLVSLKLLLVLLFVTSCGKNDVEGLAESPIVVPGYQFIEEGKTYVPKRDVGFSKYGTKSLRGSRKVVLTYDDGPDRVKTPKLLDILKRYGVKATFFVLGSKINSRNRHIVERILKEGHHLASHDWTHKNNNKESESVHKRDLARSILKLEQIEKEIGVQNSEIYYRYPYGAYGRSSYYHHLNVAKEVSQEIYNENCLNFVFWDIDTADWVKSMTATDVAQNIISNIDGGIAYRHKKRGRRFVKDPYRIRRPIGGGIVLMHDIHNRSVEATEIFLEYALSNNIEVIPLNEVQGFSFEYKRCYPQVL